MSCGSCGTGKPNGCKSNGGCSSGGCNRMNVHDWLRNLPVITDNVCQIIEVSFKQGSRKDYYRNTTLQIFEKGEFITVEGTNGFDVGQVSLTGELVRLQLKKRGIKEDNAEIKKILRPSSDKDLELFYFNKDREPAVQARSREFARNLNLQMKLSEVEIQADGKKATFFYTADDRVDFRELIKLYATEFKVKVEMKQIGIRQEAAKVGGIGSCGRELCCSTWLNDFKSVNTTAARYQNLSINQTKLSGQCGRLKCCLNYELDTYLDALQHFPENADVLELERAPANLIKKDIFKNLMWYQIQGGVKHFPVTIERVKEIKALNQKGVRPADLEAIEIVAHQKTQQNTESNFVELVGQISLRSLERNDKRRRDKQRSEQRQQPPANQQNAAGVNNKKEQTNNKLQPSQQRRNNEGQQNNNRNNNRQPLPNKQQQNNNTAVTENQQKKVEVNKPQPKQAVQQQEPQQNKTVDAGANVTNTNVEGSVNNNTSNNQQKKRKFYRR